MTEDKTNKVQISFRVRNALKRAWDVKLAQGGKEQQAVLAAFLNEYVDGNWDDLQPHSDPSTKIDRNDRWHRLLDLVLTRGTKKQVEWLSGNLLTFAELIQLKNPQLSVEAAADEESALSPVEARMVEEFRKSSHEKRRRMLGFIAKPEDLGPEVMPSRKRGGGRS